MYVLEDGTSLTNAVKEAFKRGLTKAYIKVGTTIIDQGNHLVNVKYRDEKADPETGMFIGVTSMRELTIKLLNIDNELNLENADIEYHIGALVGEEYKYINLGNFIVQKPTNEEVNEEMTFTALDYMSKFDTDDPYTPQVVFPTTLLGLAQDVCTQAGVTLGNTNFRNASKQILANPFVNGENMRTVLKSIAKLSFSCGYIGQDNKLYFGFTPSSFSSVTEEITTDGYFENKPNDQTKKITALTLRSSEIKTVGQTIYDEEHIVEYGTNELVIEEDYIAYTDELRLAYLNGATDLFGLTYKPLSVDVLGSIYLSFNDTIKVTSPQGDSYYTYALNNVHEYNGTLYNTITVPALSEVEEQYKYETDDENKRRRTAVDINKAEQRIQLIETEIGDRSQKESSITQEIDQIELKISDLENLLVDVEGINPLTLENCLEGELIKLNIKGNNTVFSGLTPSNTLVPSNELVPYGDSLLHVYTKNKCPTQNERWELADPPLTLYSTEMVEIDTDYVGYFSFKGNANDVVLYNIYFYDKNQQFLGSFAYSFNRDLFKGVRETEVVFPPGTKYVTFYLRRVDNEGNFINFDSFDMNEIRPMLEYVSKYKNDTTYSGLFSRYWMQLNGFKNYGYYYISNAGINATEETEIEVRYKENESENNTVVLFSTANKLFSFYTKTGGDYKSKLFKYNGTDYAINTTYDYVGVDTTFSLKKDSVSGDFILTLSDSEEHEETFTINATTTFSDNMSFMGETNGDSKIDSTLYGIDIWQNGTLSYDFISGMNKSTGKIGLGTHSAGNKSYAWSNAFNQPGTNGITLFEAPDTEYQEYNYQVIDLGILEPLRQFSATVYDEFIYDAEYLYNFSEEDDNQEYKAVVIRRVGVTAGGEMYELATPITEVLSFPDIMLVNGTNYIDLSKPYAANVKATYVQITDFTKIFATQYQVTSQIIQLANSITLLVSEKVGKDEVIAQINVAVEDHQGIIRITGNQISITSDYFEITRYGEATFKKGYIGNWNLLDGHLYSDHTESGTGVRSGLVSRDNYNTFLYAGLSPNAQYFDEANFMVKNSGLCKAKWFTVNGESGYFYIDYDSGKTALHFSKDGIIWKLDNTNNNNFARLATAQLGVFMHLYDAPGFYIRDSVHDLSLLSIIKVAPESGQQAEMNIYPKAYYYAGTNTGYEIATKNDICDESVKENVKESKENALSKIERIEFKQFDWKKSKIDKEGHVGIGIIAQQVKEIDENFVEKTSIYKLKETKNGEENKAEQELYSINTLNMLTASMKAIQELNEIVKNQQKEIDELKEIINQMKKGEK